jgi:BirA family biotin operon repressor/biotin-[acetyl-CoA-carboxylase] ligase
MSWVLLHSEVLADGLNTRRVGRVIRVLDETGSTNDDAFAAAAAEKPDAVDGLVIFAEHQRAGRGRHGRSWASPRGASLLASVLLFGDDDMARAGLLTLAAGIAVCDAVREATTVWPVLRWPNDVWCGGKKLAGVLAETRAAEPGRRAWVIGIGLNCYQHRDHFPPELRDRATSLDLETSDPVDRIAAARALLRALDDWLDRCETAPDAREIIRTEWLERAEPLGERIVLVEDGRRFDGRTVDVDPHEGLLVQLDRGGRRWFDAARAQVV